MQFLRRAAALARSGRRLRRFAVKFWEPITLFTFFLVIIGAIQSCILISADDTARIQTRAWLAPRGLVAPDNFKNRVSRYTEVTLRMENIGKEQATKTNEVLRSFALEAPDFRNGPVLENIIRNMISGQVCENMSPNPNGRAIFPGGTPGLVIGFDAPMVEKINDTQRLRYALVAGCLIYQTLNKTHFTKVCTILASRVQSDQWDSINCPVHNDAD
jgi:hypothetical protein